MRLSYGSGRTRSGDTDLFAYEPQVLGRTGVVVCHAYSHTTATHVSPRGGRPNLWSLMRTLAANYPVVVGNQGGDNWNNDDGRTGVGGCATAIRAASSPARASSGPVVLVGTSMGFTVAAGWAKSNLSDVAAIVGILPLVDLDDLWNRDWNSSRAAINTAYGGLYVPATMGAERNPMLSAGTLNVPIRLYYAADDPGVLPATIAAFDAAAPNVTTVNLGSIGGHDTEAAYGALPTNDLLSWLNGVLGA